MSGILEFAGPWPMLLLGIGMVVAGGLYLVCGWRLHMVLLVAATVVGGGLVGLHAARVLNLKQWAAVVAAMICGILCGVLCGLIKRFGLFVFGGLAAVVLLLDARYLFRNDSAFLFFQIVAFLAAGSLAVLYYRPAVVLASSVLGSMGLIWGGAICAESIVEGSGGAFVLNHPAIMAILFFGLIVLGIQMQSRSMEARDGEPPAPESMEN